MGTLQTLRATVAVARKRNLTFLAAGIVYYAFTSIPSLVLLGIVLATAIVGPSFATMLVDQVSSGLSASGQRIVEEMLRSENGRVGAGIVGSIVLVWSALKLFRGLVVSFDQLYGVENDSSLVEQLRDGLVVALATALVATLLVVTAAVLNAPSLIDVPYPSLVSTAVLLVGLALVFLPVYYVMPPVEMTVRKALPGVVVAAVGWVVLQMLFQAYTARASRYAAYGLIGVVLLFVTWLYFAGIVVLLGATVNAVVGGDTAPGETTAATGGTRFSMRGDRSTNR